MPGGPAALAIAPESPFQDEVRALLAQSDAFSSALYPPESNHTIDAAALAQPTVRFLVARLDGAAVGCAGLVLGDPGEAELKRMFVAPSVRGQGTASHLLAAVEAEARREGVRVLRLETGIASTAALALYRRSGYRDRGPSVPTAPTPSASSWNAIWAASWPGSRPAREGISRPLVDASGGLVSISASRREAG